MLILFSFEMAHAQSDCEFLFLKHQQQMIQGCESSARVGGGCTPIQIAQAVKNAIVKGSLASSDALGYGFLVGGIIANAAISSGITVWVNPQSQFFPTFVGFSLGQQAAGNALEAQADAIHATYTLREQYATDRIFLFRNALRLNFQTAALAFHSGNHEVVAAEIADAAMAGYHYFKDIDPSEAAIVNTIHASFLVKIKNPSSLKEPSLAIIRDRSMDFDSKAETYYQHALDAWLVDSERLR